MSSFILDCSTAMAWCFEDESSPYADQVLAYLTDEAFKRKAIVPSLWYLEVSNVLKTAEKKKRLSEAESLHFLDLLAKLPLENDILRPDPKDILTIARAYELSAYDAYYLLLSIKHEKPLATLDLKLQQAAQKAHVSLLLKND